MAGASWFTSGHPPLYASTVGPLHSLTYADLEELTTRDPANSPICRL